MVEHPEGQDGVVPLLCSPGRAPGEAADVQSKVWGLGSGSALDILWAICSVLLLQAAFVPLK